MLIQCLPLGLQVANSPFTMSVHSYAPKGMCVLLNERHIKNIFFVIKTGSHVVQMLASNALGSWDCP